jgi:hypothetical protein
VKFYLTVSDPGMLRTAHVPLMVSHARLHGLAFLPRARSPWVLDSGGFGILSKDGAWRTGTDADPADLSPWNLTAADYVDAVIRYDLTIGSLVWAAPQDMMVEQEMLERTSLTREDHQVWTVANYLELTELWHARVDNDPANWALPEGCPFIPVVQGDTAESYLTCIEMYLAAGVDLYAAPALGVGSVCRRQGTAEISDVIAAITARLPGIDLHLFGVKTLGLRRYGHLLTAGSSTDSHAWSVDARRGDPLPGCTHANCNSCLPYALAWRARMLQSLDQKPRQLDLFAQAS